MWKGTQIVGLRGVQGGKGKTTFESRCTDAQGFNLREGLRKYWDKRREQNGKTGSSFYEMERRIGTRAAKQQSWVMGGGKKEEMGNDVQFSFT